MLRTMLMLVTLSFAPTGTASTQQESSDAEHVLTTADPGDRMKVPVRIAGSGPFRFVVDTGAERTVISREVADALQLNSTGHVRLTSLSQTSDVPSVLIPELQVGRRSLRGITAPALPGGSLGAQGLLGIDVLQKQSVTFDFRRQKLEITSSQASSRIAADGAIVVQARSRFGRLIVSNAEVDDQRVTVIIDTGSQVTLGNEALRRILQRRGRLTALQPVQVWGVTGAPFTANFMHTRLFRLGGVEMQDLPIGFGSAHLFNRLQLSDRPAVLLGMDTLRLFDRVSIDFTNRRLRLVTRTSSRPDLHRLAGRSVSGGGAVR